MLLDVNAIHSAAAAMRGDLAEGTVVGGDFEIVSRLAGGGMGEVYVARQRCTGYLRALKRVHGHLLEDDVARARFEREAKVIAKIESMHLAHDVIDVRDVTDVTDVTDARVCAAPSSACGADCVDTQRDVRHCGACNTPCAGSCLSGRCQTSSLLGVGRSVVCAGFGSPATVRCWGDNQSGDRGTGDNVASARPGAPVSMLGGVVALDTELTTSCALRDGTGEVYCWGGGTAGQLGNGAMTSSNVPVRAGTLTMQTGVTVGGATACAWRAGAASCWGRNTNGQLGDGTTMDRLSPTTVVGLSTVQQVSAGFSHTCATRTDGAVLCWGSNSAGQLGLPLATMTSATPTLVGMPPAMAVASSTSGGAGFTVALSATGQVYSWGSNATGQLGRGPVGANSPTPGVIPGLPTIAQVAAGGNHACALSMAGAVWCWGSNTNGALGAGTTVASSDAPLVVAGLADAIAIAAGQTVTCAARRSGGVTCWGNNAAGQLGQGFSSRTAELPPVPSINDAVSVHAGANFTCFVSSAGTVRCWGANAAGQLGDGTVVPSLTPRLVTGLSNVRTMDVFDQTACALRTNGTVACWGNNGTGQLANGREGDFSMSPLDVAGVAVQTGISIERHVTTWNGTTALAWGYCIEDQCSGPAPTGRRFAPGAYAAAFGVVGIGAGATHSCAIDAMGQAYCVGGNYSGQLGEPAFSGGWQTHRTIAGLSDAVEIESGAGFSCARRRDGTVACWGTNGAGQLGDGTITNRHMFAAVPSIDRATQISIGVNHACVRVGAGDVRCWGGDNGSMLGATPAAMFTATAPLLLPASRWVSAGTSHTCAVATDGTVRCWGDNSSSQLGVTFSSSTPVDVQL
jgi:alpha-tubulin suppressor-like RCC1 family protein